MESLGSVKEQATGLKVQENKFLGQLSYVNEFRKALRGFSTQMTELLPKINYQQMQTQKMDSATMAKNAVAYFPGEKTVLSAEAKQTLNALADMAEKGLVSPIIAAAWASGIIEAHNRLAASAPSGMGYFAGQEAKEIAVHPQRELGGALDQSADVFFDRMNVLAEKHPTVGSIIGTTGHWTSEKLVLTSQAVGLAALAYFAVTATFVTLGSMAIGKLTEVALKTNGVNEDAAGFYGAGASFLAAAALANSPAMSALDKGISSKANNIFQKISLGEAVDRFVVSGTRFVEFFSKPLLNERGEILIPSGNKVITGPKEFILTPRGPAYQENSAEALELLAKVKEGAPLYRQGKFDYQNIHDAQYWSLETLLQHLDMRGNMVCLEA